MAWQDNLIPAAFRGVPFHWDATELQGGRRVALFEFPQVDGGFSEDMGRSLRRYPVTAYVLGDDYFDQRDALIAALEQAGPGTLDHPYLGSIQVQVVAPFRMREEQREGRMARFTIDFVEAGGLPAPRAQSDTASTSLACAGNLNTALMADFGDSFSLAGAPNFVQQAGAGLITNVTGAMQALLAQPGFDTSGIGAALDALTPNLSDAADIADGVIGVFSAVAATVSTVAGLVATVQSLTETSSRGTPPVADRSYGVASFAGWGADLPAIAPATASLALEANNQAAFQRLVNGAAIAGMAQIYAQTEFASTDEAGAARDQITGLIDDQALAASAAGSDALCQAWDQLYAAVAQDLTLRGKGLPDVITLILGAPMPALALAQRLYQDATRAPELVARNDAIHPLFMPTTIEALSS